MKLKNKCFSLLLGVISLSSYFLLGRNFQLPYFGLYTVCVIKGRVILVLLKWR